VNTALRGVNGKVAMNKNNEKDKRELVRTCQAMQWLNAKYCKSNRVSRPEKDGVYSRLKVPMIEWLYRNGFCTWAKAEKTETPCYWCLGSGRDIASGLSCWSCGGTGLSKDARQGGQVVAFKFVVHGTRYGWHLPKRKVPFQIDQSLISKSFLLFPCSYAQNQDLDARKAKNIVSTFLASHRLNIAA